MEKKKKDNKNNIALYISLGIFGLIMLIVLIVSISGNSNQNSMCPTPYIEVGGKCCLDKDSNKICDDDEKESYIQQPVIIDNTPTKEPSINTNEERLCDIATTCQERAKEYNSAKYCEYILELDDDYQSKKELRASCYSFLALDTNNKDYCSYIPSDLKENLGGTIYYMKDTCYNTFLSNNNHQDGSVCENMISSDSKNNCYYLAGIYTGEPKYCNKIDQNYRFYSDCFYSTADCQNDYNVCGKIDEENKLHDYCIVEIYREKRESDVLICNKLSTEEWKRNCNLEVSGQISFVAPKTESFEDKCRE